MRGGENADEHADDSDDEDEHAHDDDDDRDDDDEDGDTTFGPSHDECMRTVKERCRIAW